MAKTKSKLEIYACKSCSTLHSFEEGIFLYPPCDACGGEFKKVDSNSMPWDVDNKIYSLCEAVADIAYIAGSKKYYSGNSRQDISDFIFWAKEFENINKDIVWGINSEKDYIEAIEEFIDSKIL